MINATIRQCQFFSGSSLSPISTHMESKNASLNLLALADILKQFVNLRH